LFGVETQRAACVNDSQLDKHGKGSGYVRGNGSHGKQVSATRLPLSSPLNLGHHILHMSCHLFLFTAIQA
jgi:hypothetical protein